MKRLITLISGFAFITATTFVGGCKKQGAHPAANTCATVAKINSLGNKYSTKHTGSTTAAKFTWKQYAAADAIGAVDGVVSGSVAGVFGSICGGITYGVFASCALDIFSGITVNPTNPVLSGINSTFGGTPVGCNEPGNNHNAILAYVITNSSQFGPPANPNLTLLKAHCTNTVCSTYNFDADNLAVLLANCKPYADIVTYAENPASYFETMGLTNFRLVSESFFNTAFAIDDMQGLRNYYDEFVEAINLSPDFSNTEKAGLITYGSVATASLLYHNNQ